MTFRGFFKKTLILTCLFALPVLYATTNFDVVYAGSTIDEIQGGVRGAGGGSSTDAGTVQVKNTIKTIINILLFLVGSFAVIMIVIAGFRFVTANGDANTVSQAKNTIIYSVIGIVVAVMAYAIVNFILGAIT